jgi:hypothetical protein
MKTKVRQSEATMCSEWGFVAQFSRIFEQNLFISSRSNSHDSRPKMTCAPKAVTIFRPNLHPGGNDDHPVDHPRDDQGRSDLPLLWGGLSALDGVGRRQADSCQGSGSQRGSA